MYNKKLAYLNGGLVSNLITNRVWDSIIPTPFNFKEADHPVIATYDQAKDFCAKLSLYAEREFRLPTEEQWKYISAEHGNPPFTCGTRLPSIAANFNRNKGGYTTPIESYPPNRYGLSDLHGNVWEWCTAEDQPPILKGGSFMSTEFQCQRGHTPDLADIPPEEIGFRILCPVF
jgi:formylglycine-generating enzyme required for sulfatase activity